MIEQGNPYLTGYHCDNCYKHFELPDLEKEFRKLAQDSEKLFDSEELPEIRKKVRECSRTECPACQIGDCHPQAECSHCGAETKIFVGLNHNHGHCRNCENLVHNPVLNHPERRAVFSYLSQNPRAIPREIYYHLKIDRSEVEKILSEAETFTG